ncbi:MAG TPA: hypothetical protein VGR05_02165, partial [Sphingomicrobium sp.]|nr:hypothetical protein [Sphingomicrobium sp.]
RTIEHVISAISKSKKPIDEVQMTMLRARLACTNHKRGVAAGTVATDRMALGARLWVTRCLDRPVESKSLLLAGLEREEDRLEALTWLQPDPDRSQISAFERSQRAAHDLLRRDPDVIDAVARHGIIHAWLVTEKVPTDLAPARPKRPPVCGDVRIEPLDSVKVEELVEKRPMP